MIDDWDKTFFEAVEKAIRYGGSVGPMKLSDAFNIAAEHVGTLLEDAFSAFERHSFGTCVFLAITAIEETAKAELLGFRARQASSEPQKGPDPMRDHKHKHKIAVRPTTMMGRLPGILGNAACERLAGEATSGRFKELRETALYVHADHTGVRAPATEVRRERAREILLLALEAADDIIVGWTSASFELGERFETMIEKLSGPVPPSRLR